MKSLYKSEIAKKEILSIYDQKLNDLQIDCKTIDLETKFGTTHIIVTGDSTKPPILLIHGSNGCAPIALETFPSLTEKFQVFAVDVLAQPNKSAETRLSMNDDSYGLWIQTIIDKLSLTDVTLVGFSFGGLIILKTLITDETKIKEVYLSAPAFIVNGNPFVALWKVFIPMKTYMRTKKEKYVKKIISALFSEEDDFALSFLSRVMLNFEMDFTPVPVIKDKEAAQIQTPITLFGAKNDFMFPGQKMIKRANKIFSSLKQTVLLENSKHVLNKEDNSKLEKLILGK